MNEFPWLILASKVAALNAYRARKSTEAAAAKTRADAAENGQPQPAAPGAPAAPEPEPEPAPEPTQPRIVDAVPAPQE